MVFKPDDHPKNFREDQINLSDLLESSASTSGKAVSSRRSPLKSQSQREHINVFMINLRHIVDLKISFTAQFP